MSNFCASGLAASLFCVSSCGRWNLVELDFEFSSCGCRNVVELDLGFDCCWNQVDLDFGLQVVVVWTWLNQVRGFKLWFLERG